MSLARSVDGEDTFVAKANPAGWTVWISFRHAGAGASPAGVREPVLAVSSVPVGRTIYVPGTVTYSWSLPGVKYESGPVESGQLWLGGQLAPLSGDTFRQVSVRWWLTILVTAAGSWAAIARALPACKVDGAGLCRICGYDLRASGERCPECGTLRGVAKSRVAHR